MAQRDKEYYQYDTELKAKKRKSLLETEENMLETAFAKAKAECTVLINIYQELAMVQERMGSAHPASNR